jgi:GMP synthase (glutamine-hydrolysing)
MDKIAVIDFGGQYAHLIANRVRRLKVFAEVISPTSPLSSLTPYRGLIFSGGPSSVYSPDQPEFNPEILKAEIPVLGICYGHQLICLNNGGKVSRGKVHEFGASTLQADLSHPLFQGLSEETRVWMSHGDEVAVLSDGFRPIGKTDDCRYAAVADDETRTYGLQFHPEVTHTTEGMKVLDNFLSICNASRDWNMKFYFKILEKRIREQCADKNVFLLVSGGVDSTVTFALLNKILGPERVKGLHIDNGMMRKDESAKILQYMKSQGFHNLEFCDAGDVFLEKLQGVVSTERKRKIIGDAFFEVMEQKLSSMELDPHLPGHH